MDFLVIADDLTGSSDSGVQFTKKGLRSSVLFNQNQLDISKIKTDVLVIDTDSRGLSADDSYQRVFDASVHLRKYPFQYLYKKIDSTLRGNIGVEIDAILDVFPKDFAIIAPAYPSIGRTTLDGNHYLDGIMVHQTEIARDPKTPVLESNIAKLLSAQSKRLSGTISLEVLRKGEAYIHSYLKEMKNNGIELVVVDIQGEEDLNRLTKYLLSSTFDILWVGSAGLAEHLSSNIGYKNGKEEVIITKKDEPVILVAGSMSKITKEQVNYLRGKDGFSFIELNPILLFERTSRAKEIERCKLILLNEIQKGKDIVLTVGTELEQIEAARANGEKIGLDRIGVSNYIANSLGEIILEVIDRIKISGFVLTGGDTAKAVCQHIHVHGMKLMKEVETGIPMGVLIGEYELPTITKAGAFGSKETLLKSVRLLKGDA